MKTRVIALCVGLAACGGIFVLSVAGTLAGPPTPLVPEMVGTEATAPSAGELPPVPEVQADVQPHHVPPGAAETLAEAEPIDTVSTDNVTGEEAAPGLAERTGRTIDRGVQATGEFLGNAGRAAGETVDWAVDGIGSFLERSGKALQELAE